METAIAFSLFSGAGELKVSVFGEARRELNLLLGTAAGSLSEWIQCRLCGRCGG